jgi:hypothetical protein
MDYERFSGHSSFVIHTQSSFIDFQLYWAGLQYYSRPMTWYYHSGGQQQGPISDAELASQLQSGKINRNTPVWREGIADWQPLSVARPDGAPPIPVAPDSAICAECGKAFPEDELVTLNKSLVCAQCKPIFLQRMAEGVPTSGQSGLWREGKKLVTRSETPFPDRCVKCNAPANGYKLKRVLYWHHPAIYLLLLCNILVLLIVSLIVRKKAVLHIGLCEAHRKQRVLGLAICWGGVFAGIVLICVAIAMESGWLALAGAGAFFFGIIWGIVKARTIAATKIDNDIVWLSGVGPAFLNQLPQR